MSLSTAIPVSDIQAVTLRLCPGDDLKKSVDQYVEVNHIQAGCIITCVGSLRQAAIRYANLPAPTMLEGKFEVVSMSGTLAEAGSHLHIIISDGFGKTIGGHLKEGSLVYTTVELVLAIFPGLVYERLLDATYGFKELYVRSSQENTVL